MHQFLFQLGFFTLRSYGLIILLAVFLGTQVAITMAHFTAPKFKEHIVPLAYTVLVAAIVGARFWQVFFFEPGYYFTHPAEMIAIWHGGLSIQGGVIGGILAGIWYCRRHRLPFWELADLLAPAIILGQGIGRIACLLNGDAFGKPTGAGFGIVYPPGTDAYATFGSQPLWPAEVWEGQLDFVIFAVIFALSRKKLPQGVLFLLYNVFYATGRLLLEYLRGDSPRFLGWTAAQWTSAVVIIVAVILILLRMIKRRQQIQNSEPVVQ